MRKVFFNCRICIATLLCASSSICSQDLKLFKDSLQGKTLSVSKWASSLDTIFENKAAGWAYQVVKDNKVVFSRQGGYAVLPVDMQDGKGVPFTVSTVMHIASISKAITALGMAKLLGEKKLSWDEKVSKYLPSAWKLHPGFADLTIRQLMRMESGLNAPLNVVTSSVDTLKLLLEKGPDETRVGKFNYQNTSYGLLRIITAYLLGYRELSDDASDSIKAVAIANLYINYVKEKIFKPAGVVNVACKMETADPAFMYAYPHNNLSGVISGVGTDKGDGDLSVYAGGFGWYISVSDLARLFQQVFGSRTILSKEELDGLLQVNYPVRLYKNKYGEYLQGGGDWRFNKSGQEYTCGLQTSYYIFPDNIQLVVFHNSAFSARGSVMRTYLGSFE